MSKTIVTDLYAQMSLPVICSPMFSVSNPKLVIAQCMAGVIGSMPALNARPQALLDDWLHEISSTLDAARKRTPRRALRPTRSIKSFTSPTIASVQTWKFAPNTKCR